MATYNIVIVLCLISSQDGFVVGCGEVLTFLLKAQPLYHYLGCRQLLYQ